MVVLACCICLVPCRECGAEDPLSSGFKEGLGFRMYSRDTHAILKKKVRKGLESQKDVM